jgi:hemolysin D
VSVVRAILVKDGDRVQAGQVLVELDATRASADQASVTEQLSAATDEAERAQALLNALAGGKGPVGTVPSGGSPRLLAEWSDITAKRARLQAELSRRQAEIDTVKASIAKLQATLPLARQREADFEALARQGFVAGHANQDRTRERIELEQDLATQQARLRETEAAWFESRQQLAAFLAETQRALSDRRAEALLKQAQLAQETTKAQQRTELTRLTAPTAGTVQQLAIHTPGGVVTEAQPLMVIVPDDAEVTAEVTIDNKDIGFVSPGQKAAIKLETFPFTKYGTVPAEVTWVTADAVNDEKKGAIFPATLKLQAHQIDVDGKPIRLAPGMNLTAEIKTGKRRVIEYLLSPVQRNLEEGLRER